MRSAQPTIYNCQFLQREQFDAMGRMRARQDVFSLHAGPRLRRGASFSAARWTRVLWIRPGGRLFWHRWLGVPAATPSPSGARLTRAVRASCPFDSRSDEAFHRPNRHRAMARPTPYLGHWSSATTLELIEAHPNLSHTFLQDRLGTRMFLPSFGGFCRTAFARNHHRHISHRPSV